MNEDIKTIIQSIGAKCVDLKSYVNHHFSLVVIPRQPSIDNNNSQKTQEQNWSKILGCVSGISLVTAVLSSAKLAFLSLAGAAGYGAYKLSSKSKAGAADITTPVDINEVKNAVTNKIIEIVKHVSNSWDSAMELNQRKVHTLINDSDLSALDKDAMMSKVLVYEVIDIRISEFSSKVMTMASLDELKTVVEEFKMKLLTAIDEVAQKQIEKYQSIKI
ncbi:MAG: hypothetical protein HDR83_00445 [Bacteroides sp.]|nr:hypothetical protein [Bacteroides sp.]